MKCCVISYKGCWQDEHGDWLSSGGFPLQINAISSLFDKTTLVTVSGKPGPGGIRLAKGIQVKLLKQPRGSDFTRKVSAGVLIPYYVREIGWIIRQSDAVHIPVPGDIPLIGLVLALLIKKPVIARYGSSWQETSRTTLMNRVTKALMSRFAGGRNVMMATGMGEQPPSSRMHWLFSTAITEEELSNVQPDLNRQAHRPLQFAYVGRFSVEKGVITLLQALSILRDHKGLTPDDLQLTLIGEGPLYREYHHYIERENLQDWISFAGQLDRPTLTQCLMGMDVVVLPSLTESFCKARLDAMLCGVPVLTTEVGFGREITGNNGERGWIIPPEEPSVLAEKIHCLINEPQDWPGLRYRCRAYVEELTLEKWVRTIGEICVQQWNVQLLEGKLLA